MSAKLLLLKSGETIICNLKEIVAEEKVYGYLLIKPNKIEAKKPLLLVEENSSLTGDIEISISPWIILTKDDEVVIPPDWIVTIVNPIETLEQMYEEKINGESSKVSFTES